MPQEIRFYHLERSSSKDVLPGLLGKIYGTGKRCVVKCDGAQTLKALDDYLWSYSEQSFLPHGSEKTGNAPEQPIWLTLKDENPNDADILVLDNIVQTDLDDQFSMVCILFNGHDPEILSEARGAWKTFKDADKNITYWQQTDQGWQKRA